MNNTDGVNNSAEPGMSDALDAAHDAPEVSTPTGDLVPVTTPGEIATTETAETQHSESDKQPAKQPKQPKKPRPTVQGSFAGGTWLALIAGWRSTHAGATSPSEKGKETTRFPRALAREH